MWPYRLEWWGPSPSLGADTLLVQMEFRDPKLNEPVAQDQIAKVFQLNLGKEEVKDLTTEITERISASKPPPEPASSANPMATPTQAK
jgi:hypothetical protein